MKALLILLLLSAATSSYAQPTAATTPPVLAATHADSVAIVRQAFRSARHFARFGTIAEGFAASTQVAILASGQLKDSPGRLALSITGAAGYSGFLVVFLNRWVRFSKAREEEAVRRFELHQPQPLYVQRQLVAYAIRRGRK